MNPNQYLQSLHSEPFFMRADDHAAFAHAVQDFIQSGSVGLSFSTEPKEAEIPGVDISAGYAFVPVTGMIDRNAPDWAWRYGFATSLRVLEYQLFSIEGREDVHTVVFLFNTSGGRAAGVPEVASQIEALRGSKRLIGWVDTDCRSAGMYLAAPCHEIHAMPSASVGSVSTMMSAIDSSKAWAMNGLARVVFTDGELKTIGLDGLSLTEAQTEHLAARLREVGEPFKSFVQRHRPGVTGETMTGGSYSGPNAFDAGYVDGFANSLPDLVAHLIDTRGAV